MIAGPPTLFPLKSSTRSAFLLLNKRKFSSDFKVLNASLSAIPGTEIENII